MATLYNNTQKVGLCNRSSICSADITTFQVIMQPVRSMFSNSHYGLLHGLETDNPQRKGDIQMILFLLLDLPENAHRPPQFSHPEIKPYFRDITIPLLCLTKKRYFS